MLRQRRPANLSENMITAFIADPARIPTHEIALEVLDCLDAEIADIHAQIEAARIESTVKPLSPDRQAWLRRACYAAAMRQNEHRRVMQRDKEIRGTKHAAQMKPRLDPEAQQMKQGRLLAEQETRRDAKRFEVEKQKTLQMQLAAQKRNDAEVIRELRARLLNIANEPPVISLIERLNKLTAEIHAEAENQSPADGASGGLGGNAPQLREWADCLANLMESWAG